MELTNGTGKGSALGWRGDAPHWLLPKRPAEALFAWTILCQLFISDLGPALERNTVDRGGPVNAVIVLSSSSSLTT
jgi:hypothetical protein